MPWIEMKPRKATYGFKYSLSKDILEIAKTMSAALELRGSDEYIVETTCSNGHAEIKVYTNDELLATRIRNCI